MNYYAARRRHNEVITERHETEKEYLIKRLKRADKLNDHEKIQLILNQNNAYSIQEAKNLIIESNNH